jgi:hypothetical protein
MLIHFRKPADGLAQGIRAGRSQMSTILGGGFLGRSAVTPAHELQTLGYTGIAHTQDALTANTGQDYGKIPSESQGSRGELYSSITNRRVDSPKLVQEAGAAIRRCHEEERRDGERTKSVSQES